MSSREERRKKRQQNIKITKTTLYSKENSAFTTHLTVLESWELLAKISKESWYLETGKKAPNSLDKSKILILVKS